MKNFLYVIGLTLLTAVAGVCQNTTISATAITDTDGAVWANAVCIPLLLNPSGQSPKYAATGLPINTPSCSIDASGNLTGSVASNTAIVPYGTQWIMQIQPLVSVKIQSLPPLTITGASQNLSTFINANIQAPRYFQPMINAHGYVDAEMQNPVEGASYLVASSATPGIRGFHNGAWTNFAAGGASLANQFVFGLSPATSRTATITDLGSLATNNFTSTSIGSGAGNTSSSGYSSNVAVGFGAAANLSANGFGVYVGHNAGNTTTSCNDCVAVGESALANYTGNGAGSEDGVETCIGAQACFSETAGFENVAVGHFAASAGNNNSNSVFVGTHIRNFSNSNNSVIIGHQISEAAAPGTGYTSTNDVIIGANAYDPAANPGQTGVSANCIGIGEAVFGTVYNCQSDIAIGQNTLNHLNDTSAAGGNIAIGNSSLNQVTTGTFNTAVGYETANNGNPTMTSTTLIGYEAGFGSLGNNNTIVGANSAIHSGSATAANNTAVGSQNLIGNTFTGSGNTVVGFAAGQNITTGINNTYIGIDAGQNNITGSSNIAIGVNAMIGNGISNAVQIGTGTNSTANTVQYLGFKILDNNNIHYAQLYASNTGAATLTGGTGVTSVTCIASHCNTMSGEITVVGGTATTGTIATISFASSTTSNPVCIVQQNGSSTWYGIGATYSSSAITITSANTVVGATININYHCDI
jgi:hypothetical protein